jgi:hypothetical protein
MPAPEGSTRSAPEKRREPRRPAHGLVEVRWSDPVPATIRGSMVDLSASGFRMAHTCTALEAGLIVEFTHDEAQGRARVVWTRVLAREAAGHRVESGFLVLD